MWCRALALACLLCAPRTARGQPLPDAAFERLEAINAFWLLSVRPSSSLEAGSAADAGDSAPSLAAGLGLALLGLEKRGAAWEALRLDRMQGSTHAGFDVAFTFIDLRQLMFGTDVDHDLCVAAFAVIAFGDCQYGGLLGARALLLHHAHDTESGRWFHRWVELGVVLHPIGDSFDVDFVKLRMPITLGASLDHVANLRLPSGEPAAVLRGLIELQLVHRFAGYRLELSGAAGYRPALAPVSFDRDYAVEGRVRLAYVWLAALFGSIRSTAQRIQLELRASHWGEPFRSERASRRATAFYLGLGLELTLRSITPS